MDEGMSNSLPEAFLRRVKKQLGENYPLFLEAMKSPAIRGLRLNPFRSPACFPDLSNWSPVSWVDGGYEIPLNSMAGVTIAHEAGAFYLQDPSAMLPAVVLDPHPGEQLLDLCAAPGGKSTQIGLDMAGEGMLVCNEPIPRRAVVLSRNIERMGIPNAIVTCAYPEQLAEKWPDCFDGILVDAPCSGEGMFRRHPETISEWSADQAAGCAARQKNILDQAAKMLRPGGRMVYSTCTWNPAENENQIASFLERHPDFYLAPFSVQGIGDTPGYYTCWPYLIHGEGQFMALLRKKGASSANIKDGSASFPLDAESFRVWKNSGISTREPNAALGQNLVWIERIPDLTGIHVLRLGLHLGQCRKRVFYPDHAAALEIHKPKAPEVRLSDEEALCFLAGETLPGKSRGWTLLVWRELVLGWGKCSEGMIRNHYPKGLRNNKLIC